MKRAGNLYSSVIDFENLWNANRKALKGSNRSNDALKFQFCLEKELVKLRDDLKDKSYTPGEYRYFKIYEPKERNISVAPYRDRVVHHALVNIMEPIFERIFIYDSYATRKDKGTHRAVLRTQEFMRKNKFYLKFDIRKYFENINHDILMSIIQKKIKCSDTIHLNSKIISNGGANGVGLPIGNLTSQFHANVYLNSFDYFVKEKLFCKHYIRYMDDCVIFGDDRVQLKNRLLDVRTFLFDELCLRLKDTATQIGSVNDGISFLGMRIYKKFFRFKQENFRRSINRIKTKCYDYRTGAISSEKLRQSLDSIFGYASYYGIKYPVHRLGHTS